MATWTLSDIRTKIRQVTGRLSPGELSNERLDDYVNKYYQFTFPAELKLEKKHTYYDFLTKENQAWYDFPSTLYTNVEPPAYIDNLHLLYYQDPAAFIEQNSQNFTRLTPWVGDGVTTNFNTSVTGFPIMPSTVVLTDETEVFEDPSQTWTEGDEVIAGSLGGTLTLNYKKGTVNAVFNTAPADGQNISLSYEVFKPGRPTAVLFYDNQFRFFPPPNTAYRFRIKAYSIVSPLVNATDQPELDQWGPCIAYGASRDILSDLGEMDAYAEVTALYKEQLAYVLKRTNQSLLNTRATPNF